MCVIYFVYDWLILHEIGSCCMFRCSLSSLHLMFRHLVNLAIIYYSVLLFPLQTVDVFAIVALSGILSRLLSTGTVLVATSNRAPRDLNQVHT